MDWATEEKLKAGLAEGKRQMDREREQSRDYNGVLGQTAIPSPGYQDCCMQAEARPHNPIDDQNDAIRRISNRLDYYAPRPDQIIRHQAIRDAAKAFVTVIVRNTVHHSDDSRAAQQAVEAAVMLANKSIALE